MANWTHQILMEHIKCLLNSIKIYWILSVWWKVYKACCHVISFCHPSQRHVGTFACMPLAKNIDNRIQKKSIENFHWCHQIRSIADIRNLIIIPTTCKTSFTCPTTAVTLINSTFIYFDLIKIWLPWTKTIDYIYGCFVSIQVTLTRVSLSALTM